MDQLKFVYEKAISKYLEDKVIDYITGAQEGFLIAGEGPSDCGSCTSC
ncbi:MAG: hypothetical protein GX044_06100 [Firmicutes bacterium]|nr:hypothetical protein [Bacillota bacterium]